MSTTTIICPRNEVRSRIVANANGSDAATMSDGPVENDLDENDEEEQVPFDKGSYRLVRLADEESSVASSAIPAEREHILLRNLIPDQAFSIRGIRILDGEEAVRFLKFVVITFIGLLLIHWFVALMVRIPKRTNRRVCMRVAQV
jgi:hypothetical protein